MEIQDEPVVVTPIDGEAGAFRVVVRGSVHVNVAWLENALKRVAAAGAKRVEVDLADVPHVSSMGMGVLVSNRRAVVAGGGTWRVVAVQKPVMGALRFAGLDRVLGVEAGAVVERK